MKILVPVKRVIDPYVKIRVKSDGTGVETQQVKMVLNPFDEIALEEAIRLKEKGMATEVVCVSIGAQVVAETLRQALALGACRAIHVVTDAQLDSLNVAKVLKQIVQEEQAQLVLMGKQAIDSDANQTPQMLAALLDWPQACFASKIEINSNEAVVMRETDAGLEKLSVSLPAVISADLRLNEPRYATLPNIMKAKSKPLVSKTVDFDASKGIETMKIAPPVSRSRGVMLHSVDELIEKLKPIIKS